MGVNAQTSVPKYTAGEVLTAANQNISAGTGVPVFATTATRDAAFGGTGEKVLAEGQTCYIEDAPNRLMIYDGATWRPIDIDTWTAYTPTVTAGTGSFTTVSGEGKYAVVGKSLFVRFRIVITTNGTAGGSVIFTSPLNTASFTNGVSVGVARELAVNGTLNNVTRSSATTFDIITANNGYPGGTGYSLAGFAVAEVA
jgi:hypothetical protein